MVETHTHTYNITKMPQILSINEVICIWFYGHLNSSLFGKCVGVHTTKVMMAIVEMKSDCCDVGGDM